jgi:hypothetical protein
MSKTTKTKKKSNIIPMIVFIIIGAGLGYFIANKKSTQETYGIKSSGSEEGGWRASFINLTGEDTEEKKIGLSDDYWTGGKFK